MTALCVGAYFAFFPYYVSMLAIIVCIVLSVGCLVSIVVGGKCQARSRWTKLAGILFAVTVFLSSAGLWRKLDAERRIGAPNEYDVFMRPCGTIDRSYVQAQVAAVLREVECAAGPIVPPSRSYFVFVHPDSGENDATTLALGYLVWGDDPAWRIKPALKWLDSSSLQVRMGPASVVTLKRYAVDGISILYARGGSDIGDGYRLTQCGKSDWCDHNIR